MSLLDLFTFDEELNLILLEKFSGISLTEQYKIDNTDIENDVYCFYNLNSQEVKRILQRYRGKYEFELRDSKTGKIIEINIKIRNYLK